MKRKFYNPRKAPFSIHGLCELNDKEFARIPSKIAETVSGGLHWHNYNTAGVRVRFATDSSAVTIKYDVFGYYHGPHMTAALVGGADVYVDDDRYHRFLGCAMCDLDKPEVHLENTITLLGGMHEYTINLPLYGAIKNFEIGLDEDATIKEHTPYKYTKPVLFYGSSITQGACASRPGICYENIISRELDCDYINLGYSGHARAEDEIVDYMSSLDVSVFVSDYDHNTPTIEHLRESHYKMYETFRKKHPDTPYVMITKPDFKPWEECDVERRTIIMESYVKAFNNGDRNVYFVDGAAFFAGKMRQECVVDNTHPTDMGMERMADSIGDTLKYIFYEKL